MSETEITIEETPELERRNENIGWFVDPRRTVLLYLFAFVAVGAIGAYVSLFIQAVCDAVLALIAINHAVLGYRVKRTAGLVMAAIFTIRLMIVCLPATQVSVTTRTAIIAAASILIAYVATWVLSHDISLGRSKEGFPLHKPFITRGFTTAVTIAAAFPIGWIAHELLEPKPLVLQTFIGGTKFPLIFAIGALAIGAFGEELIYRRLVAGMVQHTARSQTSLISAAIFAAAYLGTRDPLFIALMFVTGALYAWSCERTGSIRAATISHAIASILVFVVLP